MGGGIILAHYAHKLTPRGKSIVKKINKVNFDKENFNATSGIWNLCSDYCARYNTDFVTEDDVAAIEKVQRNSNLSLRKIFSRSRIGLLFGIFLETEKINASGKLKTSQGDESFSYSFTPTQKVRWELRPTIDLRPSDTWSLKIRPYFKLPMPWQWHHTVSNGTLVSKLEDYRIDLETSLSIGLNDFIDNQNKNVDFILIYNMYYDNAPQRIYVEDPYTKAPVLFAANKFHKMFSFNFKVDF